GENKLMSLLKPLSVFWQKLTGVRTKETATDAQLVALRRQLAEARLQAQELEQRLQDSRARLQGLEQTRQQQIQQAINSHLESLFRRLAGLLAQLQLQDGLMQQGKEIAARDIMLLVRQLVEVVQQAGLEPIGSVGEVRSYDPEWAQPLVSGAAFNSGEDVTIRFIGYRFQGQVLRKALVERAAGKQGGA
ncbi:MAG: nucleotide exchange factor GrpE, partial [bacterium]|nr:nucleotide exchange factor GrpE [bacterium]